jgi:HlyD family secretion protein
LDVTLSDSDIPQPKRSFPFAAFTIAVCLGGAGLGAYKYKTSSSVGPELISVAVEKGSIKATVSATGSLEALTTVTVGSQVSGPVRQVMVDFNSQVRAGQVLAVLDPSEFLARLHESEASLEGGRADLASAEAGVATARVAVDSAQSQTEKARANLLTLQAQIDSSRTGFASNDAQIHRAKAEMDLALLEYKRFEQLFSRQLVAASERDQKRTAYQVASATYEGSLATRNTTKATVHQNEATLAAARNDVVTAEIAHQRAITELHAAQARVGSSIARVRQLEAAIARVQVDLERTTIKSPVAGTVIDRKIEPGQTVTASFNAPELFKIAKDLSQMQVRADISEADIGKVAVDQTVTFTVDAYPEEKFKGKVNQVRTAPPTAANGNNVVVYGVIISAPNPKLQLKPGMTATVAVETKELKDVLIVPDEALRFLPPKPPDPKDEKKRRDREKGKRGRKDKESAKTGRPGVVWVESATGPERRDVLLGAGDGKYTEIKDGQLKEGEKVFTKVLDDKKKSGFQIRL